MIRTNAFRIATLLAVVSLLVAVPTAFAGKGGTRGNTSGGKLTGSLNLVLVDSTDGSAHYGQRVKFDVRTTAPWPFVDLDCSQAGTPVYHATVSYSGGWALDWFTLGGWSWTGGAADCVATLYNFDGTTVTPLNTYGFHVVA